MPNDNDTPFDRLDLDSLYGIRQWMREAVEARGAIFTGGSVGVRGELGMADISMEIGGHKFIVEIIPIKGP